MQKNQSFPKEELGREREGESERERVRENLNNKKEETGKIEGGIETQ